MAKKPFKDRDPNTNRAKGRRAKRKGAEGERSFAKLLSRRGFPAIRGRQFSGSEDSPDVICKSLEFIHFEVKRVEKLNINVAMRQAKRDCGIHKVPCVAHRKNSEDWLLTMTVFDWLNLIQCLLGNEDELNSFWSKLDERGLIGERGRNREITSESGEGTLRGEAQDPSDGDLL